ncbi:hypothetical protein CN433_23160 [Bacillus cereus]|nr:hypothetical protein CON87_31075 [Bacillus cereus]PET03621.1 hypothetical protein CN516_29935 [Bacillus cereus]PEV83236.1 hypothetical protein CN433_23160 [Bacillus cereus]PFP46729.1 hypothetical protein COJ98_22770 [Bacillus cereus]
MNQLLNETLPNGTSKSYTYDGFGNRTLDEKYKYTWNEAEFRID